MRLVQSWLQTIAGRCSEACAEPACCRGVQWNSFRASDIDRLPLKVAEARAKFEQAAAEHRHSQ